MSWYEWKILEEGENKTINKYCLLENLIKLDMPLIESTSTWLFVYNKWDIVWGIWQYIEDCLIRYLCNPFHCAFRSLFSLSISCIHCFTHYIHTHFFFHFHLCLWYRCGILATNNTLHSDKKIVFQCMSDETGFAVQEILQGPKRQTNNTIEITNIYVLI